MVTTFSPGQDCKASGSGGWCVTVDSCRTGCQLSGEPTSARLRRTEAELGSALAALTRAEHERDELTRLLLEARQEIADSKPCAWRGLAEQLMREQPGRIYVAREPSGTCIYCGGPIVRGQAIEARTLHPEPDWVHSACPDKEDANG